MTIVGGGSYQWAPELMADLFGTPALAGMHLVLEDIDPAPLPKMEALAHKLGAHYFIDNATQDVAKALNRLGDARAVLATVTSAEAMTPAGLAVRGRLVVVGVDAKPIQVSPLQLIGARPRRRRVDRLGGHPRLQRADGGAVHERSDAAREGGRGLRPHDEGQGTLPGRAHSARELGPISGRRVASSSRRLA